MTTQVFTNGKFEGAIAPYLHPEGCRAEVGGLTVMAMPPGRVDLDYIQKTSVINIVPARPAQFDFFRLNGTRQRTSASDTNATAFYPSGSELAISCENLDWEVLLEFEAATLARMMPEQADGVDIARFDYLGGIDRQAALLAQMTIAHLRGDVADRLYLEGLAIAMTARTLAFAAPGSTAPSTRGTDARVARAMDYLHAHLTEGLTVEELAAVACMSPSWFSRAFKAQTGRSVHVYVLEQRLERARTALILTAEPVGTIAHACGFADHSHLTRLFRRRYGVTPSEMRG